MLAELDDDGIIPAGAGRSLLHARGDGGLQDHPRGCGEKFFSASVVEVQKGSSPRVRGEVRAGHRRDRRQGIIPAGAGRRLEKV